MFEARTTGQAALNFVIQSKNQGLVRCLFLRFVNRRLQPLNGEMGTP